MGRRYCALILGLIVAVCVLVKVDASQSRTERLAQELSTANLTAQAAHDRIYALPGQPFVPFAQYSGYVPVGRGNVFFYYFSEAVSSPSTKPLILWLNGGPGCSSVGYGVFEELGPYRVKPDGASLERNPYAWNSVANVLFLDSPAGVGFSYSNSSNFTTGDTQVAADNLQFLQNWFEIYPQYKHRDFYIAGESYAGHYVPQLAQLLLDEQNQNTTSPVINLKGLLVGNPVTDNNADSRGSVDFWYTHALMSDETYAAAQANCNFTSKAAQPACVAVINQFFGTEFGNLDVYGIYLPICLPSTSGSAQGSSFASSLSDAQTPRSFSHLLNQLGFPLGGYDPCKDQYVTAYLNRPDVQHAIHANTTGNINYPWAVCSKPVNAQYLERADSVLPIYQDLIAAGLRIWLYSGDTDAALPVTATRYSIDVLQLPIKTKWYPWYLQHEVGGWTIEYDGITFVTVRGGGHLVPTTKPIQALALITNFLAGQLLPPSP